MNVTVEELGSCQKKLTISISQEDVNKEYQKVLQDLRKNVSIPGFRKGKASISTIKRRFQREMNSEVKEKLIETSLKDALVEQKIAPIGTPSVDVKNIKVAENQPVEYTAEVEFIPPFDLNEYKGVEITKPKVAEPTDDDITQSLTVLQRQNAVNEPVDDDHVIVENDSVTVNYRRRLEGEDFGDPIDNYSFWIGVDNVLPEFTQNILGKKTGDEVTFFIHYGDDIQNPQLAGKDLEFIVTIVKVEKVVLPELDDEFAKDLEEESLDAVKEKIVQGMKAQREREILAETKNRLLLKIADTHDFDVPPSLIKEQQKKYPDKEEDELIQRLRAGIVMTRIQEAEELTVTEEEFEAELQRMADQHQIPVATMKAFLGQQGSLERLYSELEEAKTLDFLYEHAQISEEE